MVKLMDRSNGSRSCHLIDDKNKIYRKIKINAQQGHDSWPKFSVITLQKGGTRKELCFLMIIFVCFSSCYFVVFANCITQNAHQLTYCHRFRRLYRFHNDSCCDELYHSYDYVNFKTLTHNWFNVNHIACTVTTYTSLHAKQVKHVYLDTSNFTVLVEYVVHKCSSNTFAYSMCGIFQSSRHDRKINKKRHICYV